MNNVSSKTFKNQDVMLDGNHYDDCKFESCTFVYAAADAFGLSNNHITGNTNFRFTGAAANTLATMKAIYSMGDFGKDVILKSFQDIAPDIKNLH